MHMAASPAPAETPMMPGSANALENAAREREIDACERPRNDARQTNMIENAVVLRRAVSEQCRKNIARGDLDRAQ